MERSDLSEMTLPVDKGPPLRPPPTSHSEIDPLSPSALPKNSISQLNLARIETDRSDAPVSLSSPANASKAGPNQVFKMQRVMSMESDESLPAVPLKNHGKKNSSSVILRSTG